MLPSVEKAPVHDPPDLATMDEDDQHREVYAWAGLALYEAQVFEQGVTNVLFAARLVDRSIVDEFATADEFYARQESKPLGPVLQALRRHLPLDQSIDARCGEAHRLRNFLVHRFFAERIELFATVDGRQTLLAELPPQCSPSALRTTRSKHCSSSWATSSGSRPSWWRRRWRRSGGVRAASGRRSRFGHGRYARRCSARAASDGAGQAAYQQRPHRYRKRTTEGLHSEPGNWA